MYLLVGVKLGMIDGLMKSELFLFFHENNNRKNFSAIAHCYAKDPQSKSYSEDAALVPMAKTSVYNYDRMTRISYY